MSIHDVDRPVDIDALAETFSGPGPYPWTTARDVRLALAELRTARTQLAKMGPVYEAAKTWRDRRYGGCRSWSSRVPDLDSPLVSAVDTATSPAVNGGG